MPEFLRRFLSPEAQGGAAAVLDAPDPQPEIKPVAGTDNTELAAELERVSKVAGDIYDGKSDVAAPTPPPSSDAPARDEKGRFLPKTPTADAPATPPATVPQPEARQPEQPPAPSHPSLDPVFVEAVKGMGLTDADLAGVTTEDEVLTKLHSQRANKHREAMAMLGLSDAEYEAIQRVRQSAAGANPPSSAPPPATQPTPAPAAAVEPVIPEFNENELDPETAKVVKGVLKYVADAKADMAAKLQAFQKGVEEQQRQSVAAAQAAQREAQLDEVWDKVAVQIPGFTEYFGGKPSEIKRIAKVNPSDRRVRDFMYFANDFNDVWEKYQSLGENETTLKLALRDAWRTSALSKVQAARNGNGSSNGHSNGKSYMPGSVVTSGANRISPMEPAIADGDLDAEMKRIESKLTGLWDSRGSNPFNGDARA